jgi:hypothetical protein
VRWKARISALVLVILTGVPLSGTVCAFLCEPAAQSQHHTPAHHADAACAQPSRADGSLQMHGLFGHDCRSHTLTAQWPATFAPERMSGSVSARPTPALQEHTSIGAPIVLRPPLAHAASGGTPPLLVPSIVLRV